MEFDWLDASFDLKKVAPHEIEESFEDPFGLRLLPESDHYDGPARYYNFGRAVTGRGIFSVFRSDGKLNRVIVAREMTGEETALYERRNSEMLG